MKKDDEYCIKKLKRIEISLSSKIFIVGHGLSDALYFNISPFSGYRFSMTGITDNATRMSRTITWQLM
jgi:hypothetical protein